jgi:phytoene dehydrogenase-like protein
MSADAIVVGSGPNGLVAANLLADQGWKVTVLEEQDTPGGAVKSGNLTGVEGFTSDYFSAFYPLAGASPVITPMGLERYGLKWFRSEGAVAHPLADGSAAFLSLDLEETAANLDAYAAGDGDKWKELYALYEKVGAHLVQALMTPFPPVKAGVKIAAALREDLIRFARFGILPVRRLAEETFTGAGGANLLAGNALHADLTPDSNGGGLFGWLLAMLGQDVGFPVPQGGAGNLVKALIARLEAGGGEVITGVRVTSILVEDGKATGVAAGSERFEARKAVLADTGGPQLYRELIPREHVSKRIIEDLENFQYDASTMKVDWALDGPIPWVASEAHRAGTIHVSAGMDHLTQVAADITCGRIPKDPFLIVGQYSMVDPSRAPAGKETAWGYTHVPQKTKSDAGGELSGKWDDDETNTFADRMETQIERLAPGFRKLILGRHIFNPHTLEAANRNLVGGAVNSGTAQLHQQLVFRPVPGTGRPETPVKRLYLASASAHPGGGVHGGPGHNAARTAIAHDRLSRG